MLLQIAYGDLGGLKGEPSGRPPPAGPLVGCAGAPPQRQVPERRVPGDRVCVYDEVGRNRGGTAIPRRNDHRHTENVHALAKVTYSGRPDCGSSKDNLVAVAGQVVSRRMLHHAELLETLSLQ